MKLTLRQRNYRPFTVLFEKKNSHVFHLSDDYDLAQDRLYRILDETGPTQNASEFWENMQQAFGSLATGLKERRPTSFYCGDVCLTLE